MQTLYHDDVAFSIYATKPKEIIKVTFDDLHSELLIAVSEFGARPDVPLESEEFFTNIIEQFSGSEEQCLTYIKANLHKWFVSISSQPEWIQDAVWQFVDGRPMTFIGQINIAEQSNMFHDDAAIFVFYDRQTGETKTVIQVF